MDYVTRIFFTWAAFIVYFSVFAFFRKEARHDCFKAAAGGTTILLAVAFSVVLEKLLITLL